MSEVVSRRDFLGLFVAPFQRRAAAPTAPAPSEPVPARVAVIQGRFCLAYRSICSVCVERCPVPGAIVTERGIPRVEAAHCTGCGVCAQVCPAPRNAILQVPRRPAP
ncbi:MAG: 4Fe-4S binding protein [Verrucomicrobia bacterium]|nr:4Fe-4S binding protein [Verrucomicrobiota bacterium]